MNTHIKATLVVISAMTISAHGTVAPYTSDANTLMLYNFDQGSGAYTNSGTKGAAFDLDDNGGATGRSGGTSGGFGASAFTGFGTSFDVLNSGNGVYNSATTADGGGAFASGASAATQADYQGADGAFTWEALINLSNGTQSQNIISRDNTTATRGANFFINSSSGDTVLRFSDPTGTALSGTVTAFAPQTGPHAYANNEWFHVAVTYDGNAGVTNNGKFYWTRLDSGVTEANLLSEFTFIGDLPTGSVGSAYVGSLGRNPFRSNVKGLVDEVRISDIARGAGDFVFIPETSTYSMAFGIGAVFLVALRRFYRK
ncbi:LamG-like jellyroll fold domain-containing protein [Rubellicoccus peritrichatus]|uniref:LamG-like jellyroll fold domain-containing protein n=1 Tax=Rubellicoccus peritrichatus TaxID=3080537 RepID=A0AAQ3QVP1_9BACT|nr:LamG-like jellyroll fold domain-containing protein [Puniceicoccus sp. CR14]WOO41027.1 LamG-like jellyroll fold domain-containing protein [Puniceicoccus sp. CR14]